MGRQKPVDIHLGERPWGARGISNDLESSGRDAFLHDDRIIGGGLRIACHGEGVGVVADDRAVGARDRSIEHRDLAVAHLHAEAYRLRTWRRQMPGRGSVRVSLAGSSLLASVNFLR